LPGITASVSSSPTTGIRLVRPSKRSKEIPARESQGLFRIVSTNRRRPAREPLWHIEAIRRLRPDVFIVVYSGTVSQERIKLAEKAGADEFIPKGKSLEPFYVKVAQRIGFERLRPVDRYWHDLPKLLESKYGAWVVCTAEGVQHEGASQAAMYEWCRQQGLKSGDFVVGRVLRDQPEAEVPADWIGR
jgi:hypothetical protein